MKAAIFLSVLMLAFVQQPVLTITSPAFTANGAIPAKYTCQGAEVSPALNLTGIPSGAKSLAIIVHDPDAQHPGGVTHWAVWNIPVTNNIPENFKGGVQGMNTMKVNGYKGMCPPDGMHHYNFKVYALDAMLSTDDNMDQAGLEKAMQGHILAQGVLTGTYEKSK